MNRDGKNVAIIPQDSPVPEVEILQDMTVDIDYLAGIARTSYYGNNGKSDDQEKNDLMAKTLLKSKHFSIFEFADVTFRLNIPIYVARQLMRYRCGSYTELSLRRVTAKKYDYPSSVQEEWYNDCVDKYNQLLSLGYKKEEAREVLPLCTMTTIIAKYNLRELFHIFEERLAKDTQPDTRRVVQNMYDLLMERNPRLKKVYEEVKKDGEETIDIYRKDNESLSSLLVARDKTVLDLRRELNELKKERYNETLDESGQYGVVSDEETD